MDYVRTVLDRIGTSDVIALTFTFASAYLFITAQDIPESLLVLTTTIVGFFFGKKQAEQTQANTIAAFNPTPGPPAIGTER
jgi:Na+/H+ antiporter NhaC